MQYPRASLRLLTLLPLTGLWMALPGPRLAVGASAQKHVVIDVETDGQTYYRVLSQKTKSGPLPKRAGMQAQAGTAYIELQNASGQILDSQTIPDPTLVFFDYASAPGQPLQGGIQKLPKTQFRLEVPYTPGNRHRLSFYSIKRKAAGGTRGAHRQKLHDTKSGRDMDLPAALSAEATDSASLDIHP